jgi:hypothetical protein
VDLHTYSFDPVILNAGLMKPRRGFTLVAGEEKWGGQGVSPVPAPDEASERIHPGRGRHKPGGGK